MRPAKGLVIVHVDGLGYDYLQQAVRQGYMPFVRHLMDDEDYAPLRYRCGVPSSTPFCQAGLLYGDNTEIPSFRWWDKQSGVPVSFGGFSSFHRVAHKYFHDCTALTSGGAAIATCYPESAQALDPTKHREHARYVTAPTFSQRQIVERWALNPLHLLDWLWRGLVEICKANVEYWHSVWSHHPAARTYVISDMLEEILLHHLTRFATLEAMKENYPVIYSAFYAYDETAHAFGPQSDYALQILRHVDDTIRHIASHCRDPHNTREYEIVILSDHGQVETLPFAQHYARRFGELVAEWLPTFDIEETKARPIRRAGAIDGHIALTYSGGLAHFYFKDISWRLQHDEIEERFPGLIQKAAQTPGIEFVLTRDAAHDILTVGAESIRFDPHGRLSPRARDLLVQYDQPDILARQLHKLNSFERSGDLILFGQWVNGHQINFEDQVGGHGSIGGEQAFPFILAKRAWNLDTSDVVDASGMYPLLQHLGKQMGAPATVKRGRHKNGCSHV